MRAHNPLAEVLMPIYKTGPDISLEDLVARVEADGERVVQVVPRQGNSYVVISETRPDDTGRAWLPSSAKETR